MDGTVVVFFLENAKLSASISLKSRGAGFVTSLKIRGKKLDFVHAFQNVKYISKVYGIDSFDISCHQYNTLIPQIPCIHHNIHCFDC